MASLVSLSPGQILEGKYQIVRELGRGAMGIVYEAQHMALGRRIAIKTLLGETNADPELVARFEREARAASAIRHPHIVDVFDLCRTPDGFLFMAMELLEGQLLTNVLASEPRLPVDLAIDLTRQVLGGLAAAHRNGIVHRDLKPDNIIVLENEESPHFVKIVDFGIAKFFAQSARGGHPAAKGGTMVGTVMGTLLYMPPEQLLGQVADIDHRADLYSAGAVLYEMLCGRPPFIGQTQSEVISGILEGRYPAPRELRREIPVRVEAAIVRALDRESEKRFASASAMRAAIVEDDRDATPSPDVSYQLVSWPTLRPVQTEPLGGALGSLPDAENPSPLGRELEHSQAVSQPAPVIELERPTRETLVPKMHRVTLRPETLNPPRSRARRGPMVAALVAVVVVVTATFVVLRHRGQTGSVSTTSPREQCKVTLALDPPEAVVHIDHIPAERMELAFEPGTAHTLEASAPGRIARKTSFAAKADLELSVCLGRTLALPSLAEPGPLSSELSVRYPSSPATRDEIQRAFPKLERYAKCLGLLGYGEGDAHKGALSSVPNNAVLSACIQSTEEANALLPPLTPLHTAAVSYLRAASQGDGGSLGRLLSVFRAQYLATRAAWQVEELARQEADDGATVAWHMRRVALAAQTWFRASRGAGPSSRGLKDARTRLEEYQRALLDATQRSPQEFERIAGAKEFVRTVEEVVALARGPSGRRSDPGAAKAAVQALVLAFNALVV